MGIRAKQVTTGTFDATTAGRAPFAAGLFDLTTANSVFAAGAIATGKLADTFVKADGSQGMTGALVMGTNKITGLASGTASTDAATKGQLDAAIAGLVWANPVAVREVIGCVTIATLNGLTPTLGDAYVSSDAGTPTAGASDALVAGSLAEFNGTSWIEIVAGSGGFPPNGTRALVSIQTTLPTLPLAGYTDIGLVGATDEGKFLQWDGTSLTPVTEIPPSDGNAVLVNGNGGAFENLGYTFNGVAPTGTWVQFAGASSVTAGAGISATGNTFNVGDAGKGVQVNADDLEFSAAEAAALAGGLKAGVNSWELAVEPNDFAGTGLEDDGADNLRLAAQGNGIAGGAGATLSVAPDTTGGAGSGTVAGNDIAPVDVSANGVGVDVTRLDGDHLDITFTATNYTPDAGPAEAADVNDLAAHLKGVDNAIGAAGGTSQQESVTTQVITGSDTAITDTLNNVPTSAASVKLYLNGILQLQGAGLDYTLSGTTITWLAATGTAVDMDTSDALTAVYES